MFKYFRLFTLLLFISIIFSEDVYIRDLIGGLEVQMDISNGVYGIGDTAGRAITYDFDTPSSHGGLSHFVLNIDGVFYSNSTELMGSYIMATPHLIEADSRTTFLYARWQFPLEGDNYIEMEQILTPLIIDGKGLCEIKYMIYNGDTVTHSIGLLLNQDIILNRNDRAPIAAGGSYSGIGMFYRGMSVPYFWQAFEESPGYTGEQLIASGYLRGLGATKPDIFTFGNQPFLSSAIWEIDTALYLGSAIFDAGMILRWEPQDLNADKDQYHITYLGLGESGSSGDSLVLFSLAPEELTANCTVVTPDPFEISLLLYNQGLTEGVSDISACFNIIPEGITPTFGDGHWPDSCHHISDLALGETGATAWLFALDTTYIFPDEPLLFEFTITTPSMGRDIVDSVWVSIPSPTGIPPSVTPVYTKRFTNMDFDTVFYVPFITDDDEGIDFTSMRGSSGPINISYFTDWWEQSADTIFLSAPIWYCYHGDTVISTIRELKDINGCSADILPVSDTIIFDYEAPVISYSIPRYGRHVDSIPVITFIIDDQPSGFDPTSVSLMADGEFISFDDSRMTYTDTSITFTSTTVYEFEDVFVISLLTICDEIQLGTNNCISEEYTIATWVDPGAVSEAQSLPIIPGIHNIKPNPANASFEIEFESTVAGSHELTIYDVTGKLHKSENISVSKAGREKHTINLTDIPSGIYLVSISGSGINDTSRLCVIK